LPSKGTEASRARLWRGPNSPNRAGGADGDMGQGSWGEEEEEVSGGRPCAAIGRERMKPAAQVAGSTHVRGGWGSPG
jgi:hypothetical protein